MRTGDAGRLKGDKAVSVVFDNSKIKRFVPGYCATVPFEQGVRGTIRWFDAEAGRREVDGSVGAVGPVDRGVGVGDARGGGAVWGGRGRTVGRCGGK